jgi:outer membrane protein TolC
VNRSQLFAALTLALSLTGSLAAQTRLSLREALDQAAKLSPDVQSAQLRYLESQAAVDETKAAYQPQLTATVAAQYQTSNLQGIGLIFPGFPSRVGPYRVFDARPRLTQTVLDLSLISGIRASRERAGQFKQEALVTRESTLLAVLQVYLQALQAESRVTAADARLKTAEAVLEQTRDLESSGAASKLDIARAEQQTETERFARINAQKDRDVLVTLLLRTIGMEQTAGDANANVSLVAPMIAPQPPSQSAERAEVGAANARIRAAELEKQRAERERLPKIQAFGDYGVLGTGPEQSLSTYAVGGAISVPLWTGRRIESQIAEAKARIGQAEQELRRVKLQIDQEVKQARVEMDATRQAITAAEKSAAAARTSVELARLRFSAGLATNIDTIVAQGTEAQAEEQEIQARYDHLLARAKLARAQGDVYSFFQ